ncbi:MAG: UDP-N-acetylmuramoyl-L-alanyl-D-glutamate--2,6-diaminopimelate ligase [Candidatus Saganbacteria bacterium]|nr:UDP-N-acetylmuramoyl-L-alanyl-D-glutamate--2,6-diaminopimelate ligase [Candidatus Saganbacteria bacterium]
MKLNELIKNIKVTKTEGDLDFDISGIAHDSRKVKSGDVFVAVPGLVYDGTHFIPMALSNGAGAVVTEKDADLEGKAAKIIVPSSRTALADLSCAYFGFPSRKLKIAGITGTNGKTTTAYLLDSVFRKAGLKTGLIGTVETKIGDRTITSELTTPESTQLQGYFAEMIKEGVTHVAMEVSSHSIAMKRIKGIEFDAAVYTNLSHDHLDFHKTLEAYFDTKMYLFRTLGSGSKKDVHAIVNADDGYCDAVLEETGAGTVTYSLKHKADITAKILRSSLDGLELEIKYAGRTFKIMSSLTGDYNAYNILAAFACAGSMGIDERMIVEGIEALKGVPGRFEKIDEGQDFRVIVDFAHSPDSLEKILKFASNLKKGRVISVFGCTGERDRLKRPLMGEISFRNADLTILTSDDPHGEDADRIIQDVEAGLKKAGAVAGKHYLKLPDRRSAIEKSIEIASQNDIVIIAGRGHEKIQEIKGKNIYIDDRAVARQAIQKRAI